MRHVQNLDERKKHIIFFLAYYFVLRSTSGVVVTDVGLFVVIVIDVVVDSALLRIVARVTPQEVAEKSTITERSMITITERIRTHTGLVISNERSFFNDSFIDVSN